MSSTGSWLPAASSTPSIRLPRVRATDSPSMAFCSIHSSSTRRGKSHFPVTRDAGIFPAFTSA